MEQIINFSVFLSTESDLTQDQIVVKIMNALKDDDANNQIVIAPEPVASSPVSANGPWKVVAHHESGVPESGCSGDVSTTITDGKVSLYFDGGIDDDDEQRLCNLLNQLKIKLDYDHAAEFVASEMEKIHNESCQFIKEIGLLIDVPNPYAYTVDDVREAMLLPQEGLRWVKVEYERLYQQVKSGKRSVCYIDYQFSGEIIARDICTIKPRPDGTELDLSIRGLSYGSTWDPAYQGSTQCDKFVNMCTHFNVEWLDESASPTKEREIAFAEWLADNCIVSTNKNWRFQERWTKEITAREAYDLWQQSLQKLA